MTFFRYYLLLPLFLLYFWFSPFSRPRNVVSTPLVQRANATFYLLARNSDMGGVVATIAQVEDRFNRNFNYPYVLLNDVPFDDKFKNGVRAATNSKVEFGVISPEHWNQPEWIDEQRATAAREKMVEAGVKYGGSVSYRNMCRFNAGFFFQHPLMLQYRWYWRLEPDVKYHCNINFDPFLFMQEQNKTYSFTIATYELPATIPSLWSTVTEYGRKNPAHIAQGNALKFISHNYGQTYNYCHFWSNFEIADMSFWRGDTYQAFFSHLDHAGGFYYEVCITMASFPHLIFSCSPRTHVSSAGATLPCTVWAAALFLDKNQIHFFDEIGYQHDDWSHCPSNPTPQMECTCDPGNSFGA
ncbi:Glycolipid 2-alpha-mannosyltransferase 2 [Leucoagaricus sp. SymC.cos]|nr:Glycolipid 2-alpha-mannosyltransferase 2 [Leucoagaricus sp. SymC.cos]